MPPKQQASGGQKGGKPASIPLILERVLQVSCMQHDARMTFFFVKSVVPEIDAFEQQWLDDDVTGASLATSGPDGCMTALRSAFPEMSLPLRSKISACFSNRIAEEYHKGNGFINARVAQLWTAHPGHVLPQSLFPAAPQTVQTNQKLRLGKPNLVNQTTFSLLRRFAAHRRLRLLRDIHALCLHL
jgi:hypothetical protein